MRKILLTAIVTLVCSVVFAQKVLYDGVTYKISKKEAAVDKISTDAENVNLLAEVEYKGKTFPVTTINKNLVQNSSSPSGGLLGAMIAVKIVNELQLRTLVIPNSVRSIDSKAFANCGNLYKIVFPDNPIRISDDAFDNCILITDVSCHNGSVPKYVLSVLPKNCSFMISQNTQSNVGSNHIAVQQPISKGINTKRPSSDVDMDIPEANSQNENTFAVIFANENYQEEVKVDYALNDGEMFKEYCHKILGLPKDNVHIRKDATLNNIRAEISWMQQVAEAYKGQARFIVFYAGHGIPDEATKSAYLLPVDGKGTMLETGYSLAKFYETLGNMPAERVTVFMDACFSGSKRGEGMLASARGVAIKAKTQAPQGKMVVFSAAQGDETAYPLKDKEHGLFTYYLLKKLKDTKGDVTYDELGTYIADEVSRKSIVTNGKSQTPTVIPSQNLVGNWKTMKLK